VQTQRPRQTTPNPPLTSRCALHVTCTQVSATQSQRKNRQTLMPLPPPAAKCSQAQHHPLLNEREECSDRVFGQLESWRQVNVISASFRPFVQHHDEGSELAEISWGPCFKFPSHRLVKSRPITCPGQPERTVCHFGFRETPRHQNCSKRNLEATTCSLSSQTDTLSFDQTQKHINHHIPPTTSSPHISHP